MGLQLFDYQLKAVQQIKNGSILCGGVGSGKSLTSLAYYYLQNGGSESSLAGGKYIPMPQTPRDLYIITTARKRDTFEWEGELSPFLMSTHPEISKYPKQKIIVDSWNNIQKYDKVYGAFFIFDEQRVIGSGAWVKAFLNIARKNQWILLSATPGDTWQDYIPVFIANGFFKNKSEFTREHIVYSRFSKFPKVDHYVQTGKLLRLRNSILVQMDFERKTVSHHENIIVKYDVDLYKMLMKDRWNFWKKQPIENAGELCYLLRKAVNSDESRKEAILDIYKTHPKAIVFYNFDYELEILKSLDYGPKVEVAEWNGHKHQPIPTTKKWVYLVQYTSGCEGWNCIKTDTIIFYSQNYSYKVMTQAAGRTDRLNTPYTDLFYFYIKSRSPIDLAISKSLSSKKSFNENGFVRW